MSNMEAFNKIMSEIGEQLNEETITAIKAALEAKDEPVAIYGYCPVCGAKGTSRERHPDGNTSCVNGHKYKSRDTLSAPPQRKPLTYEELESLVKWYGEKDNLYFNRHEFARAIEAAHGIK